MRKIILTICAAALSLSMLNAQDSTPAGKVQMAVYIPGEVTSIPAQAQKVLVSKLNSILAKSGMAATPNITQFFVTSDALVMEKNIVPGAPTKYQQKIEVHMYVIDALGGKVFGSTEIDAHAVANSEEKAYISCFSQIPSSSASLIAFFKQTSDNIIAYYDSQYDNIAKVAKTLAQGKKYEEALWRLSMIPEACKCYNAAVELGTEIYKQYVDMQSFEELAKAKAIWNAGQDAAAAAAAGQHIANVSPNAACYPDAVALSNEIKARVKSDIDYYRKQDEIDRAREHEATMADIDAWKSVGVAFGNNQKSNTYHDVYTVR